MNYLIIDQEDMNLVSPVECGDIPAVQREILLKLKASRTPRVFTEVPFDVNVKVREDKISEVNPHKAKPGKGAGSEGDSPVRPGDERVAETVGEGSGNPGANSSAEN